MYTVASYSKDKDLNTKTMIWVIIYMSTHVYIYSTWAQPMNGQAYIIGRYLLITNVLLLMYMWSDIVKT